MRRFYGINAFAEKQRPKNREVNDLTLREEKHFCFVCHKLDKYEVVADCSASDEHDLDGRPYGEERYALTKSVQTCPYCGYSNFSVDSEIENLDANSVVASEEYSALLHADVNPDVKKFVLSAYLYEKASDFRTAGYLYLNAGWIASDKKENERASRLMEKAALCFEKDGIYNDTAVTACDCLRRSGNFKKAVNFAKKAMKTLHEDDKTVCSLKTEISLSKKKNTDAVKFSLKKKKKFLGLFG